MRLPAILLVACVSCSSPAKPTATPTSGAPPDAAYLCGRLGRFVLYGFVNGPAALDAAQAEYDAAGQADADHPAAARHFLACAAAYRPVPDTFADIEHVLENTRACYRNAIAEYYDGQLIEREGRAAVTAALSGETRTTIKAEMEAELAATSDCGPPEE